MRRKACLISVLFIMCIVSACGKTEINYNEISGVSGGQKEQKYIEYLADEIKNVLAGYGDINDIDIEITGDTDAWNVTVKISYSESVLDVTEMNQRIEELLTDYFPEGTNLSVVAE